MPILTPSQRVNLKTVLESRGFVSDEFELCTSMARAVSHEHGEQLRLKDTEYYFSIYLNESEYNSKKFWLEFSPGQQRLHDYTLSWNWSTVCDDFANYLARLRQELELDDPWKQPGVTRVTRKEQGQTLIPAGHQFTGQRLARAVFASATKSLDILDPYIGPELFERIDDAGVKVNLRILTSAKSSSSPSYFQAFKSTYPNAELRVLEEKKLHDRFIIIDGASAYHFGHSIKDLGKKDTHVSPVEEVRPFKGTFRREMDGGQIAGSKVKNLRKEK